MNLTDILKRREPPGTSYAHSEQVSAIDGGVVEATAAKPPIELPDARLPDTERIRALAHHNQAESIVFQSVAIGALQLLDKVLQSERQLAKAAISLAQREKLQGMIVSLEATTGALREALSRKGSKLLTLGGKPRPGSRTDHSWWFSLTDTMHVLEEGTEWIAMVVAGQPKGSAARLLSSIIARQLHGHYNKLLTEADQWME